MQQQQQQQQQQQPAAADEVQQQQQQQPAAALLPTLQAAEARAGLIIGNLATAENLTQRQGFDGNSAAANDIWQARPTAAAEARAGFYRELGYR